MSLPLVVNGVEFSFPAPGDRNWGANVTGWAAAVTSGTLQKAGGSFTLTAEVDFGASFGLKSAYFKSRTSNPASAGAVRFARADVVSWRNQANGADLDLGVNASNQLTFGGAVVGLSGSLVNADIASNAAIAYSKLALTGSIVNADLASNAAIAFSKLAPLAASRAAVTDGSGVLATSAATATEVGYLSGVTSALQTQLDARLLKAGGSMTGALTLSGAPTSTLHAATKQYVDDAIMGLVVHDSVRVATTGAGTLASSFENGDTVDGVVLATGDRILIKNQAATSDNGIYVVAASGAPTRATDADTWDEIVRAFVLVTAGTANAGTSWVSQTATGGTLGVSAITFGQFGSSASYTADGQGIELTSTTFSLELADSTLSKDSSGLKVASGGLTNTHINSSAAIAYSKLALTGAIVNADLSASAAVALSKLAALTASRAAVTDGSGVLTASAATATEVGYLSGVTSALQTQLDAKAALASPTFTGTLTAAALTAAGAVTLSSTSGADIKVPRSTPVDDGNSGTSKTIDLTAGVNHKLTLTGNCTITLTAPPSGTTVKLVLIQDGTGSRTVTWPTIKWSGGSAPTLSTAASARDVVSLYYDGTDYYGTSSANFA